MRKRSTLLGGVSLSLIAAALLHCTPDDGVVYRCEANDTCLGGKVCVDGHCLPPAGGAVPVALAFANSPVTLTAGQCSGPLRIALRDKSNSAARTSVPLTVSLSAAPDAGFAFFSDPACAAATSSVVIPRLSTEAEFRVAGTRTGPSTITTSVQGLGAAAQQATIIAGAPTQILITSPSQRLLARACSDPVTIELRDPHGNFAPGVARHRLNLGSDVDGGVLFYLDDACAQPVSDVAVPANESSVAFRFRGITGGVRQLSVSPADLPIAPISQAHTLLPTVRAGNCDLADGGPTTVSCPILPAHEVAAHTFLIFQATTASASPATASVRCALSPAVDRVDCTRAVDGERVDVRWQSVELPAGVRVQTASLPCAGLTTFVPIVPVDPARSFVLAGGQQNTGTNYGSEDFFTIRLSGASEVEYTTDPRLTCGPVEQLTVQVVEWQGVQVTRGLETQGAGGGAFIPDAGVSALVTGLPDVPLASTALLTSFRVNDAAVFNIADRALRATLTSTADISFDRCLGDALACDKAAITGVAWERINFGSAARVQHRVVTLAAGEQRTTVAIDSVDPTRTVVFATDQSVSGQALGESAHATDDILGEAAATFQLLDPTTVAVVRGSAQFAARWTVQVVQIEP